MNATTVPLEEVLRRIHEISPNLKALINPKEYTRPAGYEDPALFEVSAFTGMDVVNRGIPAERDTTCYSIHTISTMLIRYQVPTYFAGEEFCEALLRTEAPEDLVFSEIQWPMPAMLFMLPLEFSRRYFCDIEVPYIAVANVPAGHTVKSPVLWHGQKTRIVEVHNPEPFFCAACLAEEYGAPMHYDTRCPLSLQVGSLLDAPTLHYSYVPDAKIYRTTPAQDKKTVQRLTTLAVNILLGMTAEPELISRERMLRATKKDHKGVVQRRALWRPNIIGEHFRIEHEHQTPTGTHASPVAHWRRGHWRNQRHGEKLSLVKRTWIKPVFVGLAPEGTHA